MRTVRSCARSFVVVALPCALALAACSDGPVEGITSLSPLLSVSDDAIAFGDTWVGEAREGSVLVVNVGDASLTFASARVEGDGAFSLMDASPAPLPPTGALDLRVRFAPSTGALHAATLVVESDGGDAMVALSGTGLAPPVCEDPRPCVESNFDFVLGVCVTSDGEGPCALADPCVVDAACFEGSCVGAPRVCDGPGGCVLSTCDPVEGCLSLARHDACDVDENPCTIGVCHDDGTCQTVVVDDLTPCADTFTCSEGLMLCVDGTCTGFSAEGLPCHDGDLCTLDDTCGGGACVAGAPAATTTVEFVAVLPVLSDFPRDLGDRLVSKSELGVVVSDGVAGPVAIAHVLPDVPCLQGTMHRLSATRFVCVSTSGAPRPLLVVDEEVGAVVETVFAPPLDEETPRSFHWDSAIANGALHTSATSSFSEGVLVKVPIVGGALGAPVASLATYAGRLALGERFFVDHNPSPPFGTVSLPRVLDVTGETPVVAYESLSLASANFTRTSLGFALARGQTLAFLVNLEDATVISAPGSPVLASPAYDSIEGLRPESVDLIDGYLVGLRVDEDVVEARPLTAAQAVLPPFAAPGVRFLVRTGPRTFALGAGRTLVFEAGVGFTLRTLDVPTGPPTLVERGEGASVLVGPQAMDGIARVLVLVDGTLAFGPLARVDAAGPPVGEALLVDEDGIVAPFMYGATRGEEIRVVTEQDGAWTTHGTIPTTPGSNRLGAIGHTLVEADHAGNRLVLRTVSLVGGVVDVGAQHEIVFRTTEELVPILDVEGAIDSEGEWAKVFAIPVIEIDPTGGRIVVVSQLVIEEAHFDPSPPDEVVPPLQPPPPHVTMRRSLVEVWDVEDGAAPTLSATYTPATAEHLTNDSTSLLVGADTVMLFRSGRFGDEQPPDILSSTWFLDLASPNATYGPFEVNATPIRHPRFIVDRSPTAATTLWGRSVRRVDLLSGDDEELFTLPEDPTGVVVRGGAIFVSGATTVSLLRPVCAAE